MRPTRFSGLPLGHRRFFQIRAGCQEIRIPQLATRADRPQHQIKRGVFFSNRKQGFFGQYRVFLSRLYSEI